MRTWRTLLALIAFAALVPATAGAQTVTGTAIPGNGFVSIAGPGAGSSGLYRFQYQFSRPAQFGDLYVQYSYIYNIYDHSGQYLYGNDLYLEHSYGFGKGTKGSALFQMPADYVMAVSEGTEYGQYSGLGSLFEFIFEGDDPVNYSVSVTRLGAGVPVPEPATWAMMILGMAATGLAMRRRRAAFRTSAPA